MQLQTKALYNLVRMNWLDDPTLQVEPWQVVDYRTLEVSELLARLKALDISLTEGSFLSYAEKCNSPEELTDCLWLDPEDLKGSDQAYLLLFELWRRLLPEKYSLSLFCDELDRRIYLYDQGDLIDDEPIQEILKELEDILDGHVDRGADPKETFQRVSEYCAHDLENFIYDYLLDLIEAGNDLTASELLEGLYEYVAHVKWFDFLRARLFTASDAEEAGRRFQRLLEQLQEEPDPELLLEIKDFYRDEV